MSKPEDEKVSKNSDSDEIAGIDDMDDDDDVITNPFYEQTSKRSSSAAEAAEPDSREIPLPVEDSQPPSQQQQPQPATTGRLPAAVAAMETDFLSKLNPGTYFKRLQSARAARNEGDSKMAAVPETGSSVVVRGAWSRVVHIVLIGGRNLSLSPISSSDIYVKFKLDKERYKSQYKPRTTCPKWIEQFELYIVNPSPPSTSADVSVTSSSPSRLLDVSLRQHDLTSRDSVIDKMLVDLSELKTDVTHDLEKQLDDGKGFLRLLITVSETQKDAVELIQQQQQQREDADKNDVARKYGLLKSLSHIDDVGWLEVKVLQARGLTAADLRGTSDPYCVLQLINERRQTHTEYRTLSPQWNRTFTFNITDIHSDLEITVSDENPDRKVDFLGKLAIPLLRVLPGEKHWYQLKDQTLNCRAKGSIQLEIDVVFNNFKAAIRTFNPRQTQYTRAPDKFRVSVMKRNVARVKKISKSAQETLASFAVLLDWKSKLRSTLALLAFVVAVLVFEPFMIPVILLFVFFKNLVVQSIIRSLQIVDETEIELELDQDLDDKDGKLEKKGLNFMDRLQSVQDVCLQVQETMDIVASSLERAKNSVMWAVPWMSWLAVLLLCLITVVFYFVPLRYVILVYGVYKFTDKLRQPDRPQHIGLLEFVGRLPSDRQLREYQEPLAADMADRRGKPIKKQL